MNRRDFLKNAGAAIVPAALPGAMWSAISPAAGEDRAHIVEPSVQRITAVLYDERYADCRAFADSLARLGAKPFSTSHDAVQLWYGPLRAHLEKNPGRVAGLATYADFSSSWACGRELSYATRFEGEHDGRRSRISLAHRLRTRGDDIEIAASFADESWPARLAEALARLPESAESKIVAPRSSTATTPLGSGHPGYLSSWLLAQG
ncbi:MAG: twin-arginine translocation signal domain-containing protein [Candidatus Acidiferrales bacterium]